MRYLLIFSLLFVLSGCVSKQSKNVSEANWQAANGNDYISRYSALDQIKKKNVKELEVAWAHNTGEVGNVQCNPLIIDGVVYLTTVNQNLLALDGASGNVIWKFEPAREGEGFSSKNRGLAYWTNQKEERLYFTSGGYLNCVDLKTGEAVTSFGDEGRINLNEGINIPKKNMGITSPAAPVIYKNLVIIGAMSWTSPANVSAFDVNTGERKWIFNTIPQPNEFGYETWGDPDSWKNGAGVNVWGGLSLDPENGLVFFGTGQPKNDFYRPNNMGSQLYGNSVVALKAENGKRVWHYQTIHRDLWDLDLPYPPLLTDLKINEKTVPAAIQLTKTGNIFIFNRINGEILSEVTEEQVPKTELKNAWSSPTQPKVLWPEPFSRQIVKREDLTNLTPAKHDSALKIFNQVDTGWYTPPNEKGILYYGIHGGAEWSGAAIDPFENILYVNSNELAWLIQMKKIVENEPIGKKLYGSYGCINCHGPNREGGLNDAPALKNLDSLYTLKSLSAMISTGKGTMPGFALEQSDMKALSEYLLNDQTSFDESAGFKGYQSMGYNKFLDDEGYPATRPPWGTLNAIDLEKGEILWKVPLGEYEELNQKGIPTTGTENFGGCVVTAGGLVFIASTRDEKIRAFDKDTGDELWEYKLPFGGYATPSIYEVDGKQYLVIIATGGGKLGTQTGDAVVAFTLPYNSSSLKVIN